MSACSVADTGIGMDDATLADAVEPFFSTKGVGKGTGLGLSMVHGLAAQLGGALTIASRRGLGTKVELWLPVSRRRMRARRAARTRRTEADTGLGTVLLVDDEDLSAPEHRRDAGRPRLHRRRGRLGRGSAALIARVSQLNLLVTDHLMPGMTGTELARDCASHTAGLPVLVVRATPRSRASRRTCRG